MPENCKEYLIEKLKGYTKDDIIMSTHAIRQTMIRPVTIENIIENLLDPKRLSYALKEPAERAGEEKFVCYFGYSRRLCHCYVIVINAKVLVVTAYIINRRWQKEVEKHAKL